MNNKKISQSFVNGALIMTLGMLFVKIAGAIFKIPLLAVLGGEGMAYFSLSYGIYVPIYAMATAGLPIAISRMVSENMQMERYKDVRLIHKISVPMFLFTGLAGTLLMMLGSFFYIRYTHAPGAIYSIFALAPTVFFSCMVSIYKGYYEGLRNMIPTTIAEIVESVGKIVFGLGLSYAAMNYAMNEYKSFGTVFGKSYATEALAQSAALPFAAAGAVMGITLGTLSGFIYIFIKYKILGDGITDEELRNAPNAHSKKTLMRLLFKISVPVALGAIVMNLADVIDVTLIQRRLFAIMHYAPKVLVDSYDGFVPIQEISQNKTHLFLNGCFGTMRTVTMLLPAITQGLAISALPTMTAAWISGVKEKIRKNIETILKIATVVSFPAGLGMSVLSQPIMHLLYSSRPSEAYISAKVMVLMGIATIFVSMAVPLCSMLQAVGRADLPLKILSVGVVIKIVLNYVLVGIPEINMQGAGIGTLICYLFICSSSFYFLCKETRILPSIKSVFLKPLFCALLCAAAAYSSHGLLSKMVSSDKLTTVTAIIISAIVYVLSLFLSRTISSSDLSGIPKFKKISGLLDKFNF